MKLSQLAGYHMDAPEIALRYEAWVMKEEPYSDAAVAFIASEMQAVGRDRTGHFSASSLGSCARQQQFTWLGLPKLKETAQRMGVLINGKWMHMKIQAAGLTEGFLNRVEVPIRANVWRMKGTMDGVTDSDKIFEAKSQNSRGFRMLGDEGKAEHVFQVGTYMLIEEQEEAILFYENKDTQDTKEIKVRRTPDLMRKVTTRAEILNDATAVEQLFPVLPKCMAKEGWEYNYCSYKDRCLLIESFKQAKEAADAA